jgi:DNA helicase-2/ATP-dependent DNA helicase PcrA
MTHTWSPQQSAFIDWAIHGRGSVVLTAVAGAGKSTVLFEAGSKMPGQVAYVAFNKKIVVEAKDKLQKMGVDWKKVQAGTAHSFGFSAYRKYKPWVREPNQHKVRMLVEDLIPLTHELAIWQDAVVKLVSLAKQSAFGILVPIRDRHCWHEMAEHHDVFDSEEENGPAPRDEVIELAIQVLERSIAMTEEIDFDDMIYMPLKHRCRFWRFDVVMMDEAQDTNAIRRCLMRAMVKPGGRIIAVGDPHQAIYGFTGADADSLDLIKRDFNCVDMPLTVSFRCPRAVVKFAQQWVSHIQAAPEAPEGSVSSITMSDLVKRNDLDGESAILCRKTKPLVDTAFMMLRRRIPCRIEGKDVGLSLKKLITRWKIKSLDQLEDKLSAYLQRETTKLLAKRQEVKLAEVEDRVETVRVIIDQCRREKKYAISDAEAYVDGLFSDNVSGVLTLSTIHKAKGREWERVYWLDRQGTCPSPYARQAWQMQQEVNLMYVAATRSKDKLFDLIPTKVEEEKTQ